MSQAVVVAAARLAAAGIDRPGAEARLLVAHASGLDPASLIRDPARFIDGAAVDQAVTRRASREPLAYITGRCDFWTLSLAVSPATLIPRADSEALIEAALAARPVPAVRTILDLGTGTGCLLLAALTEYPAAWGLGIDLSFVACALARGNAGDTKLLPRCAFLCGDWDAAVAWRFDLVLCNPPYIPHHQIATLMPEVARFEPRRALDGGDDGLHAYRALLSRLPDLLAPRGLAIFELGTDQAHPVAALAHAAGWATTTRPDLAGRPRALLVQRDTR